MDQITFQMKKLYEFGSWDRLVTFVEVYVNGVTLQVQRLRLLGLSLLLDKSNIII